jgi:hypothetical protein
LGAGVVTISSDGMERIYYAGISLDALSAAVASALSGGLGARPREPSTPLAWRFELATQRVWRNGKPTGWDGWQWRTTDYEPNAGEGMRNVTPLYALAVTRPVSGGGK